MIQGRTGRRWRRGAVAAVSLLAHGIILAIVGFNAPRLIAPPGAAPPVDVWLVPRLDLRTIHASNARSPATEKTAPAVPSAPIETPAKPSSLPTLQTPPAQTGAKGPPAAIMTGGEIAAGIQRALRSRIGCDLDALAHLTTDERARCDEHFAETAKLGPKFIDTIPPEKRAYYDAVQAAYQASRHPEAPFYKDANGNIRTWGHPPAVGCTFKPHFRPGASLSDKIKATGMLGAPIGPLSCGLQLPQGSLTPELGIPTP